MSYATQRLQPRNADIASKVMEGEAIIINLANGVYYSLDRVGGLVWEQIVAMRTGEEILDVVVGRYDVARAHAQADLERLVDELVAEGLVAPYDGEQPELGPQPPGTERLPYESPSLDIYRDMGDLLALDPPTPGLDSPWQDAEEART